MKLNKGRGNSSRNGRGRRGRRIYYEQRIELRTWEE